MGSFRRIRMLIPPMILPPIVGASVVLAVAQISDGMDAESYWHQPLAAQGEPPKDWTKAEQSLAPADCGQCHAGQFAQWQTSRHARSFSAGLVGQILTVDAADTAECLQCHAPLAEQRRAFEAARSLGVAALTENQGLAAAGNSCGGCHLRQYRHFAPPQRGTGATGPSALPAPHGGVFQNRVLRAS